MAQVKLIMTKPVIVVFIYALLLTPTIFILQQQLLI